MNIEREKLKLRINDRFRIEADRYQYILIETYEGQDRDGNPKKHERESYYPTLEGCVAACRDAEVKDSETLDQIIEALQRSYTLNQEAVVG